MIAVTGANGLLGSFIVRKLLAEGLPVRAIMRSQSDIRLLKDVLHLIERKDADINDMTALPEAIQGVSVVVHTAAMVSFNPRKVNKILEVNVGGTRNVVNACLALGTTKLIHISSVAAQGRTKDTLEVTEESKWVEGEINSDYGQSKYQGELEVYRGIEEGLEATLINPSAILAPAEWNNSSAQLFQYVWNERAFYTDGSLNYVDVRDVADMVYRVCVESFAGEKFIANAGTIEILPFFKEVAKRFHKKPPTIRVSNSWTGVVAVLEEIRCRLTGKDPLITRQTARLARETFTYNSAKARKTLGIQFRTLEETLDWCCQGYLDQLTPNK